MKIKKIYTSSNFRKSFKKLPLFIKKKSAKKQKIFRNNCFAPSLKTHSLSGNLKGLHSFSIDYSYRIVFKFENQENATFIDVGTHSIYQ